MDEAEAWVMQTSYNAETDRVALHIYPLIQCKDCKYYDGNGTCMKNGIALLPDHWFCADGRSYDDA